MKRRTLEEADASDPSITTKIKSSATLSQNNVKPLMEACARWFQLSKERGSHEIIQNAWVKPEELGEKMGRGKEEVH